MLNPHIKVLPPRNKKMVNSGTFLSSPGLKTNAELGQISRFNFRDNHVAENCPKDMPAKRTATTLSDILAPSADFQQMSSGFGTLDSMARHIPATCETDYHSQNHL